MRYDEPRLVRTRLPLGPPHRDRDRDTSERVCVYYCRTCCVWPNPPKSQPPASHWSFCMSQSPASQSTAVRTATPPPRLSQIFQPRAGGNKTVRVGGGGVWRTCAMRYDEPRLLQNLSRSEHMLKIVHLKLDCSQKIVHLI